ncbi:MAG: TonB-dependent receptor [Gammaproteobacteria bacterium]|nr:TonB-dependent receptor [Gammaproteobacteria bacterium]
MRSQRQNKVGRSFLETGLVLLLLAILSTGGIANAQEEEEEGDEAAAELPEGDSDEEVEMVVVTGSRIARTPSEQSRNVVVLDEQDIRATGELTLYRVLRQLPQNVNSTNATYGSKLNGGENTTGAGTVNLRGLGSESTLILVDGRRVGYSGILGGVTDISTIPLSMVERIEVLPDGASAVYGSDAVGGVVNIITRKDYGGVEVDLDYGRPHKSGYEETRASVAGGISWEGGRAKLAYERFHDTGLDSSLRDSVILGNRLLTTGQKNTAPGPQIRVWTWFFDDSCTPFTAILWGLDGRLLTGVEYAALSPEDQARATCHNDLTLPLGFQHTDDLNSIDAFGEQNWGEEAEVGYSLRPEQVNDVVNVGFDQELTELGITLHANLRVGRKDSRSDNGLNQVSGTLHANSPFNPFGTRVSLTGLAVDQPPSSFESETNERFMSLGAEGVLGDWNWQMEYGVSKQEIDTTRINVRDPAYGLGVNSDGVSESVIARRSGIDQAACEALRVELGGTRITYSTFFGGNCTVWGAPPDPINPFGDISPWITPDVDAGSLNEQTRFEAEIRGTLFEMPAGPVGAVAGYGFRQDLLDSFSEFSTGFFLGSSSPTGSSTFNTEVARDSHAFFTEALVPLYAAGSQRLNLILAGRFDSYSNVDVQYGQTATDSGGILNAADPGSEFTWRAGLVYQPAEDLRLKTDLSTSFVAPQLNQLLSKVERVDTACLWHYVEGNVGAIRQLCDNVVENRGGNDALLPETAETLTLSMEYSPAFLSGLFLRAGWSDTDFKDRIIKLRVPVVDLGDLPSTVTLADGTYIVDNRWINTSAINRSGVDFEARYDWQAGDNEFEVTVRRSYTNKFDVEQDAATGIVHDLVGERDDSGPEDASLSPVPRHKTSMQWTWSRGGMFLALDMQAAAGTTIINSATREYVTVPATNFDMVLSYDFDQGGLFGPSVWTSGLSATLTVNNLTDDFSSTTNVNPETGERETYLVNPIYEWTQGRSYRLSLRKSF